MKIRYCLISCIALVASGQLYAQSPDPWWFDIEVIVFKRNLDTPPVEKFEEVDDLAQDYTYDLTNIVLKPNVTSVIRALPLCPISEALPALDDIVESYEQWLSRLEELEAIAEPVLPVEIEEQIPTDQQKIQTSEVDTNPVSSSTEVELLTTASLSLIAEEPLLTEFVVEDPQVILNNRLQAFIENAQDLTPLSVPSRFDCLSDSDIQPIDETFYLVDNQLPERVNIPKRIDGNNWFLPQFPHILPISEQQLDDFADKIERIRGHQILHHTVWRQEVVFGRDVAPSMRLVAGENFMASFLASQENKAPEEEEVEVLYFGEDAPLEEQPIEDFFNALDLALAEQQAVDINALLASVVSSDEGNAEDHLPEWELDGKFKVFLQNINRVPYLHVDSELVFRRLMAVQNENQLPAIQRIPFKQLRRVISKQIHYFDHPLFGLVVQIRRHQRPSPIDEKATLDSDLNPTNN